jgi:riboflavin synthase
MFTGIIQKISTVEKITDKNGSLLVVVKKPKGWKVWLGQSIAINGVCSTVKKIATSSFEVEYMPETISKTTVRNYKAGMTVNLETSLKLSDLVDGHLVQGHVDTVGKLAEIKPVKESVVLKIKAPTKFMKYIANQGSIALDGISLTVVATGKDWFTVSLVSFTLLHTNLGLLKVGAAVNIETDVLAKYLEKLNRK